MAREYSSVDELAIASRSFLEIGHKLYRMIQELPSIPADYTELAEQFLFLPICLENLLKTIIDAKLCDEGGNIKPPRLATDIERILKLLEHYKDNVDGALPDRFDDDVEYGLPFQTPCLIAQIQGTESAINMLLAVLTLNLVQDQAMSDITEEPKVPTLFSRRRLLAETAISSVKGVVRRLMLTVPIGPKNEKAAPSAMYRNHMELKEWLEELLEVADVTPDGNEDEQSEVEDMEESQTEETDETPSPSKKVPADVQYEPRVGNLHTIGRDADADGKPPHVPYDPNAVYVRINRKYLDKRTLTSYGLPWSIPKDDPEYFVIWQSLSLRECDDLFDHTKRLRLLDEHSRIEPKEVVDALLKRWFNVEPATADLSLESKSRIENLESFEKDLAVLRAESAEKVIPQPFRGGTSYPPTSSPPARVHRAWRGTTDYWKPWTEHSWSLFSSLKRAGWKPIYMRGNDAGQTWFHGDKVVHVRRFSEEYTPQDEPAKQESLANGSKEYLVIGKEWLEKEAIRRSGFEFHSLKDSWALDPRLTWSDIDILTAATSAFREDRLFRKYRNLPGGDLHGRVQLSFPDEEYLQGPRLSSFSAPAGDTPAPPARYERQPAAPAPGPFHHPTRLDDLVEEPEVQEASVTGPRSPTADSHESFVEIEN